MLDKCVCMKSKDNNTEKAILQAAEVEFLTKGYDGAKTVAIAERAGVTHAMLHYYYRSKRNLYEKILNDKIEMVIKSFVASFSMPGLDIVQRIKIGMESHFDFIMANPLLPRFIINEVFSKGDNLLIVQLHDKMQRVFEKVQREIDAAVEEGVIRPITVFDLVVDIVSLNVFTFVALPVLGEFATMLYASEKAMLEARKRENVEVIMRRILIDR